MNGFESETPRYPLLQALLTQRGLPLEGIYTNRKAARIFGVCVRTIQDWSRDGKLRQRDLPGRGRFLSEDLEEFLRASGRDKTRSSGTI